MQATRFQFGLQSALVAMTFACVFLAIAAALPPALVFSTLPLAVGCDLIFYALMAIDRAYSRSDVSRPWAIGSWLLLSVSLWTIMLVAVCSVVPGGSGPVQYTGGQAAAMAVFHLRGTTILAMVISPIACGMFGFIRRCYGNKFRPRWLLAGSIVHFLAWVVVFGNTWFFPTV